MNCEGQQAFDRKQNHPRYANLTNTECVKEDVMMKPDWNHIMGGGKGWLMLLVPFISYPSLCCLQLEKEQGLELQIPGQKGMSANKDKA